MTHGPLGWAHYGESIRALVPPWAIPIFVVVTYLGSVGFLLAVFAVDYWFGDSKRGAHAIALAVAGIALITALKAFFAVPRPPDEINVISISGYSFPSGHAVASTIAYGILAYDQEIGTRRQRYAGAGIMIVLIALSRVVLGVHYVQDVVAGVLIGLVFLAAAITLTGHRPRSGFLLALAVGVAAFVVSGAGHDGVAVLGAALGAVLAWELLDAVPPVESRRRRVVLLAGGLPVLAAVGYLATEPGPHLLAVFLLNGGVLAGVLTAPHLVRRYVRA